MELVYCEGVGEVAGGPSFPQVFRHFPQHVSSRVQLKHHICHSSIISAAELIMMEQSLFWCQMEQKRPRRGIKRVAFLIFILFFFYKNAAPIIVKKTKQNKCVFIGWHSFLGRQNAYMHINIQFFAQKKSVFQGSRFHGERKQIFHFFPVGKQLCAHPAACMDEFPLLLLAPLQKLHSRCSFTSQLFCTIA